MSKPSGAAGYEFEEVLRNYFLRTNFYVLRSLPLKIGSDDITDIDIWLYERPSGFARRRLIVDAKFKNKPKAAERLFWTKGLSEFLKVDGAYVATTDFRPTVRELARRIGVMVFDGNDLNRIASNEKVDTPERLTAEELNSLLRNAEQAKFNKELTSHLDDAKASLLENFGVASGNTCLSAFNFFAQEASVAHPNSPQGHAAVRAALLSASMAAVSLDYVANDAAFRTIEERKKIIANGLRYGNTDSEIGREKVRIATALVSQFAENGGAIARQIANRYNDEVAQIPAEIIAEQIARMSTKETLFVAARELEAKAHDRKDCAFDTLSSEAKSLVATFLDFCGISRSVFANAALPTVNRPNHIAPTVHTLETAKEQPIDHGSNSERLLFDTTVAPVTTRNLVSTRPKRDKRKKP